MKKQFTLVCLCLTFIVSAPVLAGTQQDKMKGCNKEAKANALSGDARSAFMSKCLKKDYVLKNNLAGEAQKVCTEMGNRYEALTIQVPSPGFHGAKHEIGIG